MNDVDICSLGLDDQELLFTAIAKDIERKGYSIKPNALPLELTQSLYQHFMEMTKHDFYKAGIGRGRQYTKSRFVRTDKISWINGESSVGAKWLDFTSQLQRCLNRNLFLGLFSFESHFAHYKKGDYYKLHYDAFKGQSNRVLSIVVYLNPGWQPDDGGELVIYMPDDAKKFVKVTPLMGTIVAFLSEEFAHEVLPANKDRYSIAGWFRLNTNNHSRVDPDR